MQYFDFISRQMASHKTEVKFVPDYPLLNLSGVFDGEANFYFRVALFEVSDSLRNQIHPRRGAGSNPQ